MVKLRKVLIMSLLYAPNAEVGAKRFSFLSDILCDKGFEIHVLTIKKSLIKMVDQSISGKGEIHRSSMYPRFPLMVGGLVGRAYRRLWEDYICLLDPYAGWLLPAVIKGAEIIRKNMIDVLIVTGPPFSPFVAAAMLRRLTGVKLILDYRDPWTTQNYLLNAKHRKPVVRLINRLAERIVIKKTASVVVCSSIMKRLFLERFPWADNIDIEVIHNGYLNDPIPMKQPLSIDGEKKVMIYAGELYGERRIELVARPLKKLIYNKLITDSSFAFHIFGSINDQDRAVLRELDLENIIVQRERVDYSLMLQYLKGADILFLPSGARVDYAIPFKFYDYLRARRPILALTPENSELGGIMKTIDCGETADIGDPAAIESALLKMIRNERTYTFSGAEAYSWNYAARRYADLIERV